MKKNNGGVIVLVIIIGLFVLPTIVTITGGIIEEISKSVFGGNTLNILSSNDNKDLEDSLKKIAKKEKFNVKFTYMGDLDISEELNENSDNYDAVWISNSLWLYKLNNTKLTSESKSISISPVVMGIKKSKAESLGLVGKSVKNVNILNLIKNKQIKYVMSSVTQTNDGASSYLGFLNSLAGNPEVLTESMLDNPKLEEDMKSLFTGVERVSGDQDFLEDMFVNGDIYESVIASESSLININNKLKAANKEELYLIYPVDGVPINDSTLAFIDHYEIPKKKENYLKLQKYLRSKEGQDELKALGRRTWYGGVSNTADKNIFNTKWGIDTTKYLTGTKFPSKTVITKAINLYIEKFRKPSHTVFCLDYSGSMAGERIDDLHNAMEYILTYEKAQENKLQFSESDKITVIPFSSSNLEEIVTQNGKNTQSMINRINQRIVGGSTALYGCAIRGLEILENESDQYTKTIIAMTDGQINVGSFDQLKTAYYNTTKKVPIYSITFGNAREEELKEIANLTNAKVFDGKTSLIKAFKEVRGYN